jgi:glutaredoxin
MKLSLNDTRIVPQVYVNGKYSGNLFDLRNKINEFESKIKEVVELRL